VLAVTEHFGHEFVDPAVGYVAAVSAEGSAFDIGAGGLEVLLEECDAALNDVVGLFGAPVVCRRGRPAQPPRARDRRLRPREIPRGYDA
jgi:hypothetical protein